MGGFYFVGAAAAARAEFRSRVNVPPRDGANKVHWEKKVSSAAMSPHVGPPSLAKSLADRTAACLNKVVSGAGDFLEAQC
eukprot:2743235-Pyramimonas_sp.AAC.1